MSDNRFRSTVLAALFAAGLLFLPAMPSHAAGARIQLPVTDGPAPAADAAKATTPRARATTVTSVINPMRETAPGEYEGIVPVRLPDGSWQILLDERFHQFTVARLGGSGSMVRGCVHGASGLAGWRASAAPILTAAPLAVPGGVVPRVTSPTSTTTVTWEVK